MNPGAKRASENESADERVGEAVRLDGNAAAGLLSEVFVPDITTTRAMCANCGAIRALGALPVYGQTMGAVMRCPTCDAVVLRIARTSMRLWLDPTGAKLLLMASATSSAIAREAAS
jgi:Family of unknown function (DUF6510)